MYVLVILLFASDRFDTVIDIEMQEFSSQRACELAGENLLNSKAHIPWKCEPE